MKARRMMSCFLGCALALAACGSDSGQDGGTGGSSASGGTTGTGGTGTGTGGHTGGTGGSVSSTGGTTGTGGAVTTGGTTGTGGTIATGGNGGAKATGGNGGAKATGGSGGAKATGGSAGGAAGGAPGTGGAAGGSSGTQPLCQYASGLNVAWVNFANDVPNPDLTTFNAIFKNTHDAGGRMIRWWFHTNGTVTPYDSTGKVPATPPQSTIDGVKAILNAAHTNGLGVVISLWSFDMLQGMENIPSSVMQANLNLLTDDTARSAYVTYLTALVTALKGTPGLYAYEIFNEPEGMSKTGWTSQNGGMEIDEMYIQKSVNWFADAIHTADPTARVTSGAVTFQYCSTVSGNSNKYSDAALIAAGGKQHGTLDFYEVHYYASNGSQYSAVLNQASHWALDKHLVMGEFAAVDTDGVSKDNLFTTLYGNGYDGSWAWAYDEGNTSYQWPSMKQGMTNLYNAQTSVIGACPP